MRTGAGIGIPSTAGGGAGGAAPGASDDMQTRVNATTAATAASASSVTTGARATRVYVEIGATPYSGGGTIAVGQTGSVSSLVAAGVFDATVANGFYIADVDVALSNLPILVTIGGAPAAGSCVVMVQWAVPQT